MVKFHTLSKTKYKFGFDLFTSDLPVSFGTINNDETNPPKRKRNHKHCKVAIA